MLRIALAQTKQVDDFEVNADTILRFIKDAGKQGVQIICFPEAQTVGYRVGIVRSDAPIPVDELQKLHTEVARRCMELEMACILGTETPSETDPLHGKPHNSALVISEHGQILGVHHKTKLTPMDAKAYAPGNSIETFELFGNRVGIVICFEGFRFAAATAECARQGAKLVFHPQNNTTRPNDWKIPVHHSMLVTRAAENTIWFASCNACLPSHQNCRSMVVAPDGRIHAQTKMKREELLVTDIDIDKATLAMFKYDTQADEDVLSSLGISV